MTKVVTRIFLAVLDHHILFEFNWPIRNNHYCNSNSGVYGGYSEVRGDLRYSKLPKQHLKISMKLIYFTRRLDLQPL